jgi:hypothetical protein
VTVVEVDDPSLFGELEKPQPEEATDGSNGKGYGTIRKVTQAELAESRKAAENPTAPVSDLPPIQEQVNQERGRTRPATAGR